VSSLNRRAIIDIGSNSVRLVVFGGSERAPVQLYNEKLLAGLGQSVIQSGRLDDEAMAATLGALARYKVLVDGMDVERLRVVATAATRDANNGAAFVERIRDLGLPIEILSGDDEARLSGLGVIAAMPAANGIVADLGGGSLELVRVEEGTVKERLSLPLGIFRVGAIRAEKSGALSRKVQDIVARTEWLWRSNERPIYLVGGSWRALAKVHMYLTDYPLPVLAGYELAVESAVTLVEKIDGMDKAQLKQIPSLATSRIPMLQDTAALLNALVLSISPSHLIVSGYGIREGLLFDDVSDETRMQDPLIESVSDHVHGHERFAGYGDALVKWLAPVFSDDPPNLRRLRDAACLLAAIDWSNNPEFRARDAEDFVLHGNWIGATAQDRVLMAMATYAGLGGEGPGLPIFAILADSERLQRARQWGTAIRLANRLSGGAKGGLAQTRLVKTPYLLKLIVRPEAASLVNSSVRRRLSALGSEMNLDVEIKEKAEVRSAE
jgi:exopolyphosphatase / guanosine-5'-triphosphate,3'-diphosphate pyrophosphatase